MDQRATSYTTLTDVAGHIDQDALAARVVFDLDRDNPLAQPKQPLE